jgi:serine/threonine protein kinase
LNNEDYDYKCDIWSIGVIYFFLIFGMKPFNSLKELEKVIEKFTKEKDFNLDDI